MDCNEWILNNWSWAGSACNYCFNSRRRNCRKLAERVHPLFASIFVLLLFLMLGPIYVIPRTNSVLYEIAINPLVDTKTNTSIYLLIFSFVFTFLTIILSWNTTKFVGRLGKIITPVFSILIIILISKSLITPMGSIGEPQKEYMSGVF